MDVEQPEPLVAVAAPSSSPADAMDVATKNQNDARNAFLEAKITHLQQWLKLVEDEEDGKFREGCRQLERTRSDALRKSRSIRDWTIKSVEKLHECEKKSVEDTFQANKLTLKNEMLASIQNEILKVNQSKAGANAVEKSSRKTRSKTRIEGGDSSKKQRPELPGEIPLELSLPSDVIHHDMVQIHNDWVSQTERFLSAGEPIEIQFQDGGFVVAGSTFREGDDVVVTSAQLGQVFYGVVQSFTAKEVFVQLTSGKLTRVLMEQLSSGRVKIERE